MAEESHRELEQVTPEEVKRDLKRLAKALPADEQFMLDQVKKISELQAYVAKLKAEGQPFRAEAEVLDIQQGCVMEWQQRLVELKAKKERLAELAQKYGLQHFGEAQAECPSDKE